MFFSPRRLGLLALLTLLCTALFFLSLLDDIGGQDARNMLAANDYTRNLFVQWAGKSLDELGTLAEEEYARIWSVYCWHYGVEATDASQEEANAVMKELPALTAAADEAGNAFFKAYRSYENALEELRSEIAYLSDYAVYLDRVQIQAEQQAKTNVFGAEGSFSRRNLEKTASDFKAVQAVSVEFGNNRGIEKWLDFELADSFSLVGVLMIVFSFLEERKTGLGSVIRSAVGGRVRLGWKRIGLLLLASALCALLFHGINLLLSLRLFGGAEGLGRALQSLESFRTCTVRCTVVGFLAQYFAIKVLSLSVLGLLLWCILGSVTNIQFSASILAVLFGSEYALYVLLPVQSAFNLLKYLNCFSYIHTADLYRTYLNIDLFGYPVGNRELILAPLPVLLIALTVWALLLQDRRRPLGNRNLLGRAALVGNRWMDAVRTRLGLGAWEVYKALIYEYAAVLFVLVFLISGKLVIGSFVRGEADEWYAAYVRDAQGPIDERTDAYIQQARILIEEDGDADTLSDSLAHLSARVQELRCRAAEGSYQPWLLDPITFLQIFGEENTQRQRINAAAAILFTAILCAGLASFERQAGMVGILRSTKRGRYGLFWRKAAVAVLMASFAWSAVYLRELFWFLAHWPNSALIAPVQNLDRFSAFPLKLTIVQYLILLNTNRLLMLVLTAFVACYISLRCMTVHQAYLTCVGLLVLPAGGVLFGVPLFEWISPVIAVETNELLTSLGRKPFTVVLPWLLWFTLGAASLFACWNRVSKSR